MLWNGNEVGKIKMMRILRQLSPAQSMIDKKNNGGF
jgi:hypothetical protein